MRRMKKVAAATLTAMMVASLAMGTTETWARSSKRAAWNNAAAESADTETEVRDACYVEDDSQTDAHNVKSNVYANSAEWAAWKTKWESVRTNFCQIALTPGEDATMLNAGWVSTTKDETPQVKLMDANGNEIKTYTGVQSTSADVQTVKDGDTTYTLYPCKVTITGLAENTSYKYQYYVNGAWSDTYDYKTQSTDSFSIMYVGDPQIGASTNQLGDQNKEYYAMNDSYNWYHTLNNAVSKFPNLSFIMSAGDQINQSGSLSKEADALEQQIEYAGFLNPSVLRSLPVATTIGNHDSGSVNYSNHFNYPNKQSSGDRTAAGTDYYFTYGNTLFISIDTNNYNVSTHENVIKEATEKNPDAKWRVLMFHQDIYGSGYDHSDSDGSEHSSYTKAPSSSDAEAFSSYLKDNLCYTLTTGSDDTTKAIDPKGTVYFEANSATGSKYYQLIGTQQDYIAARCQSWRPTYSVIDITDTTLTVKTYDAATNEELVADGGVKTAYTIVKQADKTALADELTKAEEALSAAKTAGNYTEESVKALEDTIAAAKVISENEESTSTDVASAVTSLQDAVKGLAVVENKDNTDTDKNGSTDNGSTGDNQNGFTDNGSTGDNQNGSTDNGNTGNNQNGSTDNTNSGSASSSDSKVKTGDTARAAVWYTVAGLSMAGAAGVILVDRKKKKLSK